MQPRIRPTACPVRDMQMSCAAGPKPQASSSAFSTVSTLPLFLSALFGASSAAWGASVTWLPARHFYRNSELGLHLLPSSLPLAPLGSLTTRPAPLQGGSRAVQTQEHRVLAEHTTALLKGLRKAVVIPTRQRTRRMRQGSLHNMRQEVSTSYEILR